MPLFRQGKHLFQKLRLHVDLHNHTVRLAKDLIAALFQSGQNSRQIRPLGDRADNIAIVVKDRQPRTQPVIRAADIFRVHPVPFQLLDHIRADTAFVHHAEKGRLQLYIRDVFHDVPAHTAVHLQDPAGIPAARIILGFRVSLDVNKHCPHHYDSDPIRHALSPF